VTKHNQVTEGLQTFMKGYAMKKNTVVEFESPSQYPDDPLTAVLREGARDMLAKAVQAEVSEFLEAHSHIRDIGGRKMIVRNGYLPQREIQTGIGSVPVRAARVRDRRSLPGDEKISFSSTILPRYLRRSKSMDELIPWLYLKGISTGAFGDALAALVGTEALGLSPATICRLKKSWEQDYAEWRQRDLSDKRYVYVWADGVYFNARMDDAQCLLVLIGATEDGEKELLAIEEGYREGFQSWKGLLVKLKGRGLKVAPKLAVGDGALGFWKALKQVYGETRRQRCWVHKTANVLNKLPKGAQKKAKEGLHEIWMAETKKAAEEAFNIFAEIYEAKYPKAVKCLEKDRTELLAFYDFPAEHWAHIRTTNPIESTFATVRLRTAKTRGCLSRATALTMAFQLARCAEKNWRKLRGFRHLADVIRGVKFVDGIKQTRKAA
jgi:putative transposase